MRPPVVIASRAGRTGTAVLGAAAVALLVWDATRTGLVSGLLHAPFVALFVWLAWLFWGLAAIRIDDDGVHVINQVRIWDVPWTSLEGVSGRWGLSLTIASPDSDKDGSSSGTASRHRTKQVRAWAAPARGTAGKLAKTAAEAPIIPDRGEEPIRTSLDSFAASRLIEIEQVQRTTDDRVASREARAHPNWSTIIITVALVVLSFLS